MFSLREMRRTWKPSWSGETLYTENGSSWRRSREKRRFPLTGSTPGKTAYADYAAVLDEAEVEISKVRETEDPLYVSEISNLKEELRKPEGDALP